MKFLRVLLVILLSPILLVIFLVRRSRRKTGTLPAPDSTGRSTPFPDVGVAFDFEGWTPRPALDEEGLAFMQEGIVGSLQLTKLGFGGVEREPDVLADLAALRLSPLAATLDLSVTQAATPVEATPGLAVVTLRGTTQEGYFVRLWAVAATSGLIFVIWASKEEDASAAEAFVRSAAPVTAPRHAVLQTALAEAGLAPRAITPEAAQLRWVTPQLRENAPHAAYEPVAGELGVVYVLSGNTGLMQAVTDEQLTREKVSREEFKRWALAQIDVPALNIKRRGPVVLNETPVRNGSLALLRGDVGDALTRELGERWLVAVPSHTGFLAAEDSERGRAALTAATQQLAAAQIVDLSTELFRVERGSWTRA